MRYRIEMEIVVIRNFIKAIVKSIMGEDPIRSTIGILSPRSTFKGPDGVVRKGNFYTFLRHVYKNEW